jgi:hypothetical protein
MLLAVVALGLSFPAAATPVELPPAKAGIQFADDENGGGQPRCDHSFSYVNLGGWTYLRVQHYDCSVDYYGPV